MPLLIALLRGTVQALLAVVQLCFLVRAILSWFPVRDDNPILSFVCMVTEPFVAPIRALFDKMGWFRNFPLDMSFFVAFVLVSMLDSLLLLL
jgi:YggT family protein